MYSWPLNGHFYLKKNHKNFFFLKKSSAVGMYPNPISYRNLKLKSQNLKNKSSLQEQGPFCQDLRRSRHRTQKKKNWKYNFIPLTGTGSSSRTREREMSQAVGRTGQHLENLQISFSSILWWFCHWKKIIFYYNKNL